MKRPVFVLLARINKAIMPSLTKQQLDLSKAKKWQLLLLAYRYWVTTNALD
jgi:hypothetical protein